FPLRFRCGLDRLLSFGRAGLMPGSDDMTMAMRHDLRCRIYGPDFLPSNDQRDLDLLSGHIRQLFLQCSPLRRSRRVGLDRIVNRRWNTSTAHDLSSLIKTNVCARSWCNPGLSCTGYALADPSLRSSDWHRERITSSVSAGICRTPFSMYLSSSGSPGSPPAARPIVSPVSRKICFCPGNEPLSAESFIVARPAYSTSL